jgi:hypothetical protein
MLKLPTFMFMGTDGLNKRRNWIVKIKVQLVSLFYPEEILITMLK